LQLGIRLLFQTRKLLRQRNSFRRKLLDKDILFRSRAERVISQSRRARIDAEANKLANFFPPRPIGAAAALGRIELLAAEPLHVLLRVRWLLETIDMKPLSIVIQRMPGRAERQVTTHELDRSDRCRLQVMCLVEAQHAAAAIFDINLVYAAGILGDAVIGRHWQSEEF
jgi:hypothetical protein